MRGADQQARPFPPQQGPVLVCANGWCLHDDLAHARAVYPHAPVIAVNGAAGAIPASMLFTLHPRKMRGWHKLQADRFGTDCTTHGAGTRHCKTKLGNDPADHDIDHWWDGALSRGSSGWSAVKAAKLMGFDFVVMCGVPLMRGDYAIRDGQIPKAWYKNDTIDHYRRGVLEDKDWHAGVVSMSGWTRETLGGIQHVNNAA